MHELPTIPPATLDRLLREGRHLWGQFEVRAASRLHQFVPCDHRAAYEALRTLRPRVTRFLEFGSAAGVTTIIADLLGIEAFGIEIEPWLVQQSVRLAADFDSGATFAEGSFVPLAYQGEKRRVPGDRVGAKSPADAFATLGLELADFDLFFVYPWPGEEAWLHEMMRRHARADAIFLTYEAQQGFRSTEVGRL